MAYVNKAGAYGPYQMGADKWKVYTVEPDDHGERKRTAKTFYNRDEAEAFKQAHNLQFEAQNSAPMTPVSDRPLELPPMAKSEEFTTNGWWLKLIATYAARIVRAEKDGIDPRSFRQLLSAARSIGALAVTARGFLDITALERRLDRMEHRHKEIEQVREGVGVEGDRAN